MAGDLLRSINEVSGGVGTVVDFAFLPVPLPGLSVVLVVLQPGQSPPAVSLAVWL